MSLSTLLRVAGVVGALVACSGENQMSTAPVRLNRGSMRVAAARVTNPLPVWTIDPAGSTNFVGDGKGDYVVGTCGLTGAIFYSNYDPATGTGGDATFDNSSPRGSSFPCPRRVTVLLDGVARDVWFFNMREVVGLAVGQAKDEDFTIQLNGDNTCERIGWKTTADGGAGGQMTVTRTSSNTWGGATHGGGRCMHFVGQTRVWGRDVDVQVSLNL